MKTLKFAMMLSLSAVLCSCGILVEDRWASTPGEVKTDRPATEAPRGQGIFVELGERNGETQKIVVKSLLEPTGISAASQFELNYDPTEISLAPADYAVVAPQVAAQEKGIVCNPVFAPGVVKCLIFGMNQNLIPNGDLATLSFHVVNPRVLKPSVAIRNELMSTVNGTAIPLPSKGSL